MARPPSPKTAKRRQRAIQLHRDGLSLMEIAKRLGITKTGAWQFVTGYDGYARRKQKAGPEARPRPSRKRKEPST